MNVLNYFTFLFLVFESFFISNSAFAQELPNGFNYHGIVVPISQARGIVATSDNNGNKHVLVWLMDYRGCYELMDINIATGVTEEHTLPFAANKDAPFYSILSSKNKYYAHFANHFIEFDVNKHSFTFVQKTVHKTAMSMTEDDTGTIWSTTYPDSGLVSYNPVTHEFIDNGQLYKQGWKQYPRYIASDDKGFIYVGIGQAATQILIFNPYTASVSPILSPDERHNGLPYLYRDINGRVYAKALMESKNKWYELYNGKSKKIREHNLPKPKLYIAGNQSLFHKQFPDGAKISLFDLEKCRIVIENESNTIDIPFSYKSEGALITSLGNAPDNTISGGTFFPRFFFRFDPKTSLLTRHPCFGQWNTVTSQKGKFFIGIYPKGGLLVLDPLKPWSTTQNNGKINPFLLIESYPAIDRPFKLLSHIDSKTIIMAGAPGYGLTGGGLLVWNYLSQQYILLKHTDIITNQSTKSLVSISPEIIMGGTTITPGTGGITKAKEAELYLLNIYSKKIIWHKAIIPHVKEYTDLCMAGNNKIYGIADRSIFFVFDSSTRKIIFLNKKIGPIHYQQGPKIFIKGPTLIYMLQKDGIATINPNTFEIIKLANSPVQITAGGAYRDGRIYFGSYSHLFSFDVAHILDDKPSSPKRIRFQSLLP